MNELMAYAATFKREKVNAKELIIGMKCGGSDGLSGITANPTVGLFSDMLVSKGGTTILTELQYGCSHIQDQVQELHLH